MATSDKLQSKHAKIPVQARDDSGASANKEPSAYFKLEQQMIDLWKKNRIFERSVEERPESKPWNFLDGPPFVTGLPHYGHIIGSILKDVFPRFKTMQGYRVRRVWGWDGHGLPIENKVEGALGIKSKKEIIERVGMKAFIEECKKYVKDVSGEWEWYIDHIGRWVNFTDAYKTWDTPYMESTMWVFKQMYEKGFIYKGLRVSLFCPHCSTPISNFEVAMDAGENYKEVAEPANTYKYKLVQSPKSKVEPDASLGSAPFDYAQDKLRLRPEGKLPPVEAGEGVSTYFLAWSTTPWTKLTTTALAINPKLTYVTVESGGEQYILAQTTLEKVFKDRPYTLIEKREGKELLGMRYEGHYTFYKPEKDKKIHIIVGDDFVSADEGTGIVTIAPYGEEDLKVMTRDGIQIVLNVDQEGHMTPDNPNGWAGMYYLKVNKLINQDLTDRGLMFHEDRDHKHSVAHCWRCHERLFFNPQEAWYVNVQKLKPTMEKTNEQVSWYPQHFKHGRYLKSMQGAPDWCISRSRYWGSPVPVWEHTHTDGEIERFVPGSIAELEDASGVKITDLHKPEIDEVTVPSKKDSSIKLRRVPEVLDSWIEAGSATFAERHFPFDKTVKLDEILPPDFITEYTGQIRAWFYVLHVISAAIYQRPAFKHVMVSGVMMGTDGRKMSKNYKNYPDPREAIEMYGADALRLYLLSSTITNAEDANMSESDWRDQLRKFIIPLLNIWNFAKMYAEVDGYKLQAASNEPDEASKKILKRVQDDKMNVLDKWLISLLHTTIVKVTASLEAFDTMTTVATLMSFVDDWSKWYVRRSRDRAGSGVLTADTTAFYETTQYVFEQFLRLIAPIVPFHSDYLYRELTGRDSVHLESWPVADKSLIHTELESNTAIARQVCEAGHQIRKANNWKVRMPLRKLEVVIDKDYSTIKDNLWQVVLDELNVKNIVVNRKQSYPKVEHMVTDEQLAYEGKVRDIIREVQALRKDAKIAIGQLVKLQIPSDYKEYSEEIKKQARITEIILGDTLKLVD